MTRPLLAPTFLFRFSTPCRWHRRLWTPDGVELSPSHRIPSFGQLEGRPVFADFRAAWSEDGLALTVRVSGKKQPPWGRRSRIEDSDGLHVWIDTRQTLRIHRAGRFCHRFAFSPVGGGRRYEEPVAALLPIHRAREEPKPAPTGSLQVRSERRIDGYLLQACIGAEALTGYDPAEHARLGFTYAVIDRELGWQTLSVGPEFPFQEDPSLWGTLELAGKTGQTGKNTPAAPIG